VPGDELCRKLSCAGSVAGSAGLLCRRTLGSLMSNVTTELLRGIAGDSSE